MCKDKYEEQNVSKALTRVHNNALNNGPVLSIDVETAKLIFVSDVHKGGRNAADDFRASEKAFNSMLAYYFTLGFTLVILGDSEELWEEFPSKVISKYKHTFALEKKFFQAGRYIRIWGNHDDLWRKKKKVAKYLGKELGDSKENPVLKVHEGCIIRVRNKKEVLGDIFAVHGHQGSRNSDKYRIISKYFVRYFVPIIQWVSRYSWNPSSPALDSSLRKSNNIAMYRWAEFHSNLVLIAGHSHRPVFSSRTHLDEIAKLISDLEEKPNFDYNELASLHAQREWAITQELQEPDTEPQAEMSRECFFNTGCCCYKDGDITAIEISDKLIKLVHWPNSDGDPLPDPLKTKDLSSLFQQDI